MPRLLDRCLLLGDGALASLFVLGYAAAYVDPRWCWWLALPATGLTGLSLLLLPALGLALLRRRTRLAACYLALLLAASVRWAPTLTSGGAAPERGDLVVMTYNAPVSRLDARPGGREDAQAAMQRAVRAAAPHLIGFQEVSIWTVGDEEAVAYPWHVAMLPTWGYTEHRTEYEGYTMKLPVFTTLPVQRQEKRLLGPAEAWSGYVLRTQFRWKGRTAVHYNVHLRSFERPQTTGGGGLGRVQRWWAALRRVYHARAAEAAHLRRMIEGETVPVIVSGDFNSTPHHWSYRHLAEGLTDAFITRGGGWGGTWPADRPLLRIDHVLAGPEWEVASARVEALVLSDHRPLVARLRWKEAGKDDSNR